MTIASRLLLVVSVAAGVTLGLPAKGNAGLKARAFAAWVDVADAGAVNQYVCDTGWLPATGGGSQIVSQTDYESGYALVMSQGTATAQSDDDCEGEDDLAGVMLGGTTVMAGYPSELTFSALTLTDSDDCCNPDDDDFTSAAITGLTFGGAPVVVTGEPNQEILIAGVGRILVNEVVHNDDDDCDDDDFTINAIHMWPSTGGQVIVGSVAYDDDEDCCPTKLLRRSWGKVKQQYR